MDLTKPVDLVVLPDREDSRIERGLIAEAARVLGVGLESATSLLCTLLWQAVLDSTSRLPGSRLLSYMADKFFANWSGPSAPADALIVGHGDPARYDLLLLDPSYRGPPVAAAVPRELAEVMLMDYLLAWRTGCPMRSALC